MPANNTPSKLNRYYANLSPYYFWMLLVESWIKGRSLSEEAGSLLGAKLMERESKREIMLERIAGRMGITRDALWNGILDGTIAPDMTINDSIGSTDNSP